MAKILCTAMFVNWGDLWRERFNAVRDVTKAVGYDGGAEAFRYAFRRSVIIALPCVMRALGRRNVSRFPVNNSKNNLDASASIDSRG